MSKERSIKEIKQNSDTVGFYESITIVWKSADRDNKKRKVKGCIFISISANDNIPTFGDLLNKAIEDGFNERCGKLTVLLESYTYGDVYRYNNKTWKKIGILDGFA